MESVTVVTEPLLHRDFVQFEIIAPILERLRTRYDITLAAPRVSPEVGEYLESLGIRVANGGAWFPKIRRSRDELPSYITSWMRDATLGWNRWDISKALDEREGLTINLSMTTAIDADVWLIQSRPLGAGLDAMRHSVSRPLRIAITAANPLVGRLDHHHLLEAGRRARVRYASTQHVADWFTSQGLPVAGVVPIYYRSTIYRSTRNPSRDYILVYVGKETDTAALRGLLETGLPVTMFGSKSVGWVLKRLKLNRYPRARLLGHVTDAELRDLYSNARFTAFPFTEEPFGMIPLESMACGTPVLTYGEQGPAETIVDGRTGWFVHSPEAFVRRALEIWNDPPPSAWMVDRCLDRSRRYQLDTITAEWRKLIASAWEYRRASPPTVASKTPRRLGRPARTFEPISGAARSAAFLGLGGPSTVPASGSPTVGPSFELVGTSVGAPPDPHPEWRSGAYYERPAEDPTFPSDADAPSRAPGSVRDPSSLLVPTLAASVSAGSARSPPLEPPASDV